VRGQSRVRDGLLDARGGALAQPPLARRDAPRLLERGRERAGEARRAVPAD